MTLFYIKDSTTRQLDWSLAPDIECMSCGPNHSLFIVNSKVYSSGKNDSGQLGHKQTTKRPRTCFYLFIYTDIYPKNLSLVVTYGFLYDSLENGWAVYNLYKKY